MDSQELTRAVEDFVAAWCRSIGAPHFLGLSSRTSLCALYLLSFFSHVPTLSSTTPVYALLAPSPRPAADAADDAQVFVSLFQCAAECFLPERAAAALADFSAPPVSTVR